MARRRRSVDGAAASTPAPDRPHAADNSSPVTPYAASVVGPYGAADDSAPVRPYAASSANNSAPVRPYGASASAVEPYGAADDSAFPSSGHPKPGWVSLTEKKVRVSGDKNDSIQAVEDTAAASTSTSPSWTLLNKTGRFSDRRNATTAECRTKEGQTVAVSFWLADPPAVSYFSVHCPGLDDFDDDDEEDEEDEDEDFSDGTEPPKLICAEGAFVLFCVTLNDPEYGSFHYFVYTARGPEGKPSLRLLPDPNPMVEAFESQQFGIVPCGDEHYAVVFLHHQWDSLDRTWQYHAYVFLSQSQTNAWKRSKKALLQLSESEQALFGRHASSKQITIGASSLGWVDLLRGIVLLSNIFDQQPVITYIALPSEKCCITDIGGSPHYAPEYFCDVTCCDGMIKFVQIEFDQPDCRSNGQDWKATTWNRMVQWNDWRRCCTVDVAKILVDPSYSALLPELMNNKKQELELKNLFFLVPTLSVHDDNLLYMLAKVDEQDNTSWIATIDMKHAALQALVPVSAQEFYTVTPYCPCSFPKYYLNNMTPGADNAAPMGKQQFERMIVAQFVMDVLQTREWFRELDQFLERDFSTYKECGPLLIQCCPVSSLCLRIQALIKHVSCTEEASNAMELLLRAFDGFHMLLTEAFDGQSSVETLRSKITVALPILDNLFQIMLPTVTAEGRSEGAVGMFEHYGKPGYTKVQQLCGFAREKLCRRKKRRHMKEKSHKQQQEILKPSAVDQQPFGFPDEKLHRFLKKRKNKKGKSRKQQQEISKLSKFRGNLALNLWLRGCMMIVISVFALAALWIVISVFTL